MVEFFDIDAPAKVQTGLPAGKVKNPIPPTDSRLRVFLSYSRKDLTTAEHIRDALIASGFGAYLDKHDILPGEPWKERLAHLIETADTVVFLISPDSIASTVCEWEVNEAERLGKRILPVVIRDAPADAVPGRLQRLNYIFLRDDTEAADGLARLEAALLTDIAWVREHTRLGERAAEWKRKSRADALLLRGSELADAELWVSRAHSGDQSPTDLHRAYIAASREAEQARAEADRAQVERTRRFQKRATWALMGVAALLVAGAAFTAWEVYSTSRREAELFEYAADQAYRQGYCDRAMRLAVAGLPAVGATPLSAKSPVLEDALSVYAAGCLLERKIVAASGPIIHAEFNPIRSSLLFVATATEARILDLDNASTIQLLEQPGALTAAAFSPDGRLVATGGEDGLRIWDAMTGRVLTAAKLPSVTRVLFDAASMRVLSIDADAVRVVDTVTGRLVASLKGHSKPVRHAEFSPDGTRVVTCSEDGSARLFDASTGTQLHVLNGHTGQVSRCRFDPTGTLVATASTDTTARVWSASDGTLVRKLEPGEDYINDARFSPDASRLVTISADRTAAVWNTQDWSISRRLLGHEGFIETVAIAPNGEQVLTGSTDGTARVWDSALGPGDPGYILRGHDREIEAVAWSHDGRLILTTSRDGSVRISRNPRLRYTLLAGHKDYLRAATFSPDGALVATASGDRTARLWDAASGRAVRVFAGHENEVFDVVFDKEGRRLATASRDRSARLWASDNERELEKFEGHEGSVRAVTFVENGRALVTGSSDRRLRRFEIGRSGSAAQVVHDVGASVLGLGRFPTTHQIAVGSSDGKLHLVDLTRQREARETNAHDANTYAVAVSADGKLLASAGADGTARVWRLPDLSPIATLRAHRYWVMKAKFSADSAFLVTASMDKSALVWDLRTMRPVVEVDGNGSWVMSAEFDPSGTRIVTASWDGLGRIWQLDQIARSAANERAGIVCRDRLKGATAFSDSEMQTPILRDREVLRHPCQRRGPLSWQYWVSYLDMAQRVSANEHR